MKFNKISCHYIDEKMDALERKATIDDFNSYREAVFLISLTAGGKGLNKLITEGTIEEKIVELQDRKRDLVNQVVTPGELFFNELEEDAIRELFKV